MYKLTICLVFNMMFAGSLMAGDTSDDKDAKIKLAMSAAPSMISKNATVLDVDGTLLKEGDNGWTCYPGVPVVPGSVDPMCNDAVWEAWLAAVSKGGSFETDTIGFSYMLQGDGLVSNDDPAGKEKDKGVWIKEGPHLMLLLPKAALGMVPTSPTKPGPYVMWGDTPLFHIMVPIADRPEGALIVHDH